MPWGIKFSSGPFLHTWVSKKATRWLKNILDGIGHERLAWMIANKRSLTSFFPPEDIHSATLKTPLPKEYLEEFPDEEVYSWIPPEYRTFIEELEGGKEWAMEQIAFLRRLIVTT
jgi:hypothetical protein